MLKEAARMLEPGGALFVYSHVRKNAPIARGLRRINALARRLERLGLIDMRQERLRKSDHLNPLADIPDLERVVRTAGFRIGRIRYYTPLVGGFVENILMRLAERALAARSTRAGAARRSLPGATASRETSAHRETIAPRTLAIKEARADAKARLARRGVLLYSLQALTTLMQIDVWLFGRVRSGPFFALLVRE